jgi:CRISPR/Cas system-associated endonuclease Cas1
LLEAGLDPMAGVAHSDNQYRDSFVYDVMEPIWPDVDKWLLEFLQNHIFSPQDIYEKKDGGIRLTLKITPILAESVSVGSENIETTIEQVGGVCICDWNNLFPDISIYA